jgi:hypothetical protein
MAQDLSSIELHPGARLAYEKEGILPSTTVTWQDVMGLWDRIIGVIWRALAILVILVGGYQGLLKLRRDRTSNRLGRQILDIPVRPREREAIFRLRDKGSEILDRVNRRYYRAGELDKTRWRLLNEIIGGRLNEAKDKLTRRLAHEIRVASREPGVDPATRRKHIHSLEQSVWESYEEGVLDASHHGLLLEVIRESLHRTEEESAPKD